MVKRIVLLFQIFAVLLVSLTACSGDNTDSHLNHEFPDVTPVEIIRSDGGLYTQYVDVGSEVEYVEPNFISGKLIYTVTSVSVVTNQADIPAVGGFEGTSEFRFCSSDKKEDCELPESVTYRYPNITDENGDFPEGGYLVLVDFHVQSNDAKCSTSNDLDTEGYPMGQFSDPYLFTPNLSLFDCSRMTEESYVGYHYDYSSLNDDSHKVEYAPGHFLHCFHLESGESVDFTLGWLVTDERQGGSVDLSMLAIEFGSNFGEKSMRIIVPLGINPGDTGHDKDS